MNDISEISAYRIDCIIQKKNEDKHIEERKKKELRYKHGRRLI